MSDTDSARRALLGPAYSIIKSADPALAEFLAAYVSLNNLVLRAAIARLVITMAEAERADENKKP